jgi:hypothetical protein
MYHVSEFRWLVMHHLEKHCLGSNYWSDNDKDEEDVSHDADDHESVFGKDEEVNTDHNLVDALNKEFGPIPSFSWVYSVKVNPDTTVFVGPVTTSPQSV